MAMTESEIRKKMRQAEDLAGKFLVSFKIGEGGRMTDLEFADFGPGDFVVDVQNCRARLCRATRTENSYALEELPVQPPQNRLVEAVERAGGYITHSGQYRYVPVIWLLNSAVVATPGLYRYRLVGIAEARVTYISSPARVSGVGYEETARVMEMMLGLEEGEIKVSRITSTLWPGDKGIVFRLTKRLPDVALKGKLTVSQLMEWPHELGLLERIE